MYILFTLYLRDLGSSFTVAVLLLVCFLLRVYGCQLSGVRTLRHGMLTWRFMGSYMRDYK